MELCQRVVLLLYVASFVDTSVCMIDVLFCYLIHAFSYLCVSMIVKMNGGHVRCYGANGNKCTFDPCFSVTNLVARKRSRVVNECHVRILPRKRETAV